jgi:proteasome lid subunit RPN8/RPN11
MKTNISLSPGNPVEPLSARSPYEDAIHWQPDGELEASAQAAVRVFVTQKAYIRICAHSSSDLENEVGGWMLGKRRQDKTSGEDFIVIDTILPARHTLQGSAFLTFTSETQVTLLNTLHHDYPKKVLVGWFHTHPRMGIFLSSYDTFIHQHFFPEIWQVALVVEPYSQSGGFFVRQTDGELDPRSYYGFHELLGKKRRSVVHWRNLAIRVEEDEEGDLYE